MNQNDSIPTSYPARSMSTQRKKRIAIEALSKSKTQSHLSSKNGVSRHFVRKQRDGAQTAVDNYFSETDESVLFTINVTKAWLEQLIIALGLIARASYREIIYFIDTVFDHSVSIGTVSSIFKKAINTARWVNSKEDLSTIQVTANDEMYHLNKPILNGIDTHSLYCYLLSQEDQRDEETWAIHLIDAQENGLNPDVMISDEAGGLLAGHQYVFPNTKCYYDNFHLSRSLMDLRRFFRNRLKTAISTRKKLKKSVITKTITDEIAFNQLAISMDEESKAHHLSSTIDTLISWLEHDVLNKAGSPLSDREILYDFIVIEFKSLELIEPHRIQSMRITLENKKASALAFVSDIDDKFKLIAQKHDISLDAIWEICRCLRCTINGDRYPIESLPLQDQFGERYDDIEEAVINVLNSTERTSSMCENLNGRVRRHIAYRYEIGHGYLDLLRFFLNHKPIERSTRKHRKGKTPAEILSGESHPHWIELLGYERFKRSA